MNGTRGLSPIVATIVLIAMTMTIAGVLSAGLSGGASEEPRKSGITVKGVFPGSDGVEIVMQSGDPYLDAYHILNDNLDGGNDNIVWNKLELRISGETASADIVKATREGEEVFAPDNDSGSINIEPDWYVQENDIALSVGDIVELENVEPVMQDGDTVKIAWKPQDQLIYEEEV